MRVLGIETSCDDTSVALYEEGRGVTANLVSSQVRLHGPFGGVVPELASRAHLVNLLPMVEHLLSGQGLGLKDLDGVAVTAGPGLIGALLVGLSTAKALAYTAGLKLAGVHHIEGHILANALTAPLQFPAAVLVVSGGHTEVVLMSEVGRYERLGATLDDAAGEAFDKVAQLLGLPYPGGPAIDRAAEGGGRDVSGSPGRCSATRGSSSASAASRPRRAWRWKSCPGRICRRMWPTWRARPRRPSSKSSTARLMQAARERRTRAVYLAGGVAANRRLRGAVAAAAAREGLHFLPPDPAYCTDNAAMIAYAGWCRLAAGHVDGLESGQFRSRSRGLLALRIGPKGRSGFLNVPSRLSGASSSHRWHANCQKCPQIPNRGGVPSDCTPVRGAYVRGPQNSRRR